MTLAEVAKWSSGGTPKAGTAAYYGGEIPWVVIRDLNDGPVTSTAATLTQQGLDTSSAKWVPAGALLVAMYGSIGKLGIAGMPLTTNQAIAAAVPHESLVETKYLFYYLLAQRNYLGRAGKGAAQQNIGQGVLKAWPIPIAPINEQRRIVEQLEYHFSRLDIADVSLRSAHRRLALLDEATVIKNLGTNGGSEQIIEGRLPILEGGWNWRALGDLAHVVGGVTKDAKKESSDGYVEVPYLRVANVQRGRLDLSTVSTIRVPKTKAAALNLVAGDVLMNEGGDRDKLARGWVWEDQIENCIHQNHVFRARPGGEVRPEWLAWCSNTYGARWAQRHGRQSVNLASISLRTIKTMPIPVPSLRTQDERLRVIGEAVNATSRLRAEIVNALRRSSVLRASLLAAAFSGRLTNSGPDIHGVPEDIKTQQEVFAG